MTFLKKLIWILCVLLCKLQFSHAEINYDIIKDTSVFETRGTLLRQHSLLKPYQMGRMDIPYWNIIGSTIVSEEQVRLTSNIQSLKGAIWNKVPFEEQDWEVTIDFRVYGSTGNLFGDGLAFWYVEEPNVLGEVFGSKDYFKGLAVFLDTYSNHNGAHTHKHPYISAMVSNGSLHYDHDSDGTHTALGDENSGCEAQFRNKEHSTQLLIRYVGNVFSVYTNFLNENIWKQCLTVPGVRLPTNYYFGISAATGDLSDYHDVISIQTYKQTFMRVKSLEDSKKLMEPKAEYVVAPRDHVNYQRPSRLGWTGTILLIIVGIGLTVGVVGFGFNFFHKRQERLRKRFY